MPNGVTRQWIAAQAHLTRPTGTEECHDYRDTLCPSLNPWATEALATYQTPSTVMLTTNSGVTAVAEKLRGSHGPRLRPCSGRLAPISHESATLVRYSAQDPS
uniref:Uncharacterized protein n=1 Tax=Mycobacterium leprae TaxID=1769 RepID=O33137_MYCLR|nr:hypothetical protein MLCL536.14 [Mycobacterium leprae]